MPFYAMDTAKQEICMGFTKGLLGTCLCNDDIFQREANYQRAAEVLQRHEDEGNSTRDVCSKWLLDAVLGANPSMVIFVKRVSDMKTMGFEVFMDHPDSATYEIYAMFGPGMGDVLFKKAEEHAQDNRCKDVIARVSPGAQKAYEKRGYKPNGPVGDDGAQPMKKGLLMNR